jgi:hypothetical protein
MVIFCYFEKKKAIQDKKMLWWKEYLLLFIACGIIKIGIIRK